MATKATRRAPRARRKATEPSDELARTVRSAAQEVAGAMKAAAATSLGAALEASGKVAASLPTTQALKVAFGRALVTGGRALIDPRAAMGEIAVRLGEGLLEEADRLRWFVVRLDENGHAATFGFVKRADAQTFFETTRREYPRQYLCESVAGPGR